MRFKESQLLRNVSRKEMNAYQKEIGFTVFGISHEEMTMAEMITGLYDSLKYSGRIMLEKRFSPVKYLNLIDIRKRVILDLSRCLVTAKKLGEDVEKCGPAEEIFDFMIKDLSQHARFLEKKAIRTDFGEDFYEASFSLYLEVCTLIRRLKVTRQGYDAIRTIPGAVLCDSPKKLSAENGSAMKEKETEHCVCPEHAISAMPTAAAPESVAAEPENDPRNEGTPESKPENPETGNREQRTAENEPKTAEPEWGDGEIEPDKTVLSEEEINRRLSAYEDPYSIDDEELLDAYMNNVLKKFGMISQRSAISSQ